MAATDFRPRPLYFAAVRLFGSFFRGGAKYVPRNRGTRVPLGESLAAAQGPAVVVPPGIPVIPPPPRGA